MVAQGAGATTERLYWSRSGARLARKGGMTTDVVIRATELSGRTVIDLDAAEKIGKVDRIVLDPDARKVAAILVSRGASVSGDAMHMTVPASAIRAVGPDAVTIHPGAVLPPEVMARLDQLPR